MKTKAKVAIDEKEWNRGYQDALKSLRSPGGYSYQSGYVEGKSTSCGGSWAVRARTPHDVDLKSDKEAV